MNDVDAVISVMLPGEGGWELQVTLVGVQPLPAVGFGSVKEEGRYGDHIIVSAVPGEIPC